MPATADSIAQLETLQQLFIARDGRLLSTLAQKMAAAGQCTWLLCRAGQGRHTRKQVIKHLCLHWWLPLCTPTPLPQLPLALGCLLQSLSEVLVQSAHDPSSVAGAKEDTFDVWMKQESDTVQVTPLQIWERHTTVMLSTRLFCPHACSACRVA